MLHGHIQYPSGFSREDIVSWGNSGIVCLDAASKTVIKSPHSDDDESKLRIEVEQRIYERFYQNGGHNGLLRYHGQYESGIRLEYAPNWDLLQFLQKHQEIETQQRLSWVRQVTDALCFIHASNVIHGDLTTNNVFLTNTLDAKVADFGGSSIDGSRLLVAANASHTYPGPESLLPSVQVDLFALGSVLYNIMTGSCPYQDLLMDDKDREIEALFAAGKFP
jgi:serine/threonine protein kinase